MTMATVQFYDNPWHYPDFKNTLSHTTSRIDCTPKGTTLKGGSIHLGGAYDEYSRRNYFALTRGSQVSWCWVDNVIERTANSVVIEYTVDPFRTYRNRLNYGRQYVSRQPGETQLFDELLSGTQQAREQDIYEQSYGSNDRRVLVVQVRRHTEDDPISNTPVQPSPYQFYFLEYNTTNWTGRSESNPWEMTPMTRLMDALLSGGETENIVTLYSLPYMDISNLFDATLRVRRAGGSEVQIAGFKQLGPQNVRSNLRRSMAVALPFNKYEFMQVAHDVKVLIPGAGILSVSDEAIEKGNVRIVQDVDLFSGGSNFMLTCGTDNQPTGQSVRGSSVSSIPILSDPFDTYISQNQNSLTTAMLGDVSSLGVGVGMMATGNPLGAGTVMSGARGLYNRQTSLADMKNAVPSNPPSFLGTALANYYNNKYYTIITYDGVDNRDQVHESFGYPINMIKNFGLPSSGFIQTQNCSVGSDGTVPRWAIQEINQIFDNGVRVRP